MKNTIIGLIVILIIIAAGWWFYQQNQTGQTIASFTDCEAAGYPIQESYPRQCLTPDGRTFTEIANSTPLVDGNYQVKVANSSLTWEGKKTFVKNYTDRGVIKLESGAIGVTGGAIATGTVVVDMTSLMANETPNTSATTDKLTEHLKSDDFFAVIKYPTATFSLTGVLAGSEPGQFTLAGNLTIRGITKPIEIPVTASQAGDTLMVNGKAVVDRSLYGVKFGSTSFFKELADNVIIDNEFKLEFSLQAERLAETKTTATTTATTTTE